MVAQAGFNQNKWLANHKERKEHKEILTFPFFVLSALFVVKIRPVLRPFTACPAPMAAPIHGRSSFFVIGTAQAAGFPGSRHRAERKGRPLAVLAYRTFQAIQGAELKKLATTLPGAASASQASRISPGSDCSSTGSRLSSWAGVRGPMIGAVMPG